MCHSDGEEGLSKVPDLMSRAGTDDILVFKNKMSQSIRKKTNKNETSCLE